MTKRDASAGFSLIEALAALVIVALLMAMMPGTLRLGKRAWETGQSGQESATVAALDFVAERLQGALPMFKGDASGLQHLQFSGGPQSLRFISEIASGPRGSGLYSIALERGASGKTELSLGLFTPQGEANSAANELRDLSAGLADVRLRYFGPGSSDGQAQWQTSWTRDDRLPDLVEITPVLRNRKTMPASVVALRLRPL